MHRKLKMLDPTPKLSRLFTRRKARYRYTKLQKNQIRLLQLEPGTREDPIICNLQIVDLLAYDDLGANSSISGFEEYEAISYVWGNSNYTIEIDCDGRRAYVTQSLADALQALRHEATVRILWADALCINQKDIGEREEQVKLMGLIYWKARCVRIWLGHDDDVEDMYRAKHIIPVIRYLADVHMKAVGTTGEQYDAYCNIRFTEPADITKAQWTALHRLLARPWFQRVWVVQELGLGRAAVFHCGQERFNKTELTDFTTMLRHVKKGSKEPPLLDLQMIHLGNDYWRSCLAGTRLELGSDPKEAETFFDILSRARGLNCTDRRDSVYAFLGHPSAFKQQRLDVEPYKWYPRNYYYSRATIVAPNYKNSNTYLRLYHQLAIAAIDNFDLGLDVIAHVAHTWESIQSDYPSWVPRWDIDGKDFIATKTCYTASGFRPSLRVELGLTKRKGLFSQASFWGLRLDTVRCVRHIPVTEYLAECLDVMALLLSDAPKLRRPNAIPIPNSLVYPYEEPFVLAFASTMTAGLTSTWELSCQPTDKNPDQHVRDFHAYYRRENALDISVLSEDDLEHASYFETNVRRAARNRLMYITNDGRLGLGPPITEGSDQVWIPVGAKMPVILRPYDNGMFKIIGQTYVHGVMRGEAFTEKNRDNIEKVTLF
ncbi:heterokaryon incompatibility protein-domain-containing protein [Boeremia exigua]|uniref:heterokaryon incompatibility protein-domain-containing protein n=1 Tax=Boeremia exigua TaxID=749465 RepID=UPI001E8CFAA8|nr:heterokaryon incompatibility protein-domain-containing protein [Boeremia exigua]KAH6611866.1 heterokaryon incompatibility protein-domain-containing protein [Boeremia exigua]